MLNQLVFTFPANENPGLMGKILAGLYLAKIHFGVIFPDEADVMVYIREENDNKREFLKLCNQAGYQPKGFKIEAAATLPAQS